MATMTEDRLVVRGQMARTNALPVTAYVARDCPHGCHQPVQVAVEIWTDGDGEMHITVREVRH